MSRVLISAAHKSSGKTTITTGISAALNRRGLGVQTFKKGPDYIDPMWLAAASTRPCHNLDFHTMSSTEIHSVFQRASLSADISIIEGNKGLYDGVDLEGSNCNAALAKSLNTPVVLVIDVRGMTRGIAPLLLGYQAFDPHLQIAGVILNKLGGSRHEQKMRNIVEHYTDIPLIGAVHQDSRLEIDERHLGLIPSNEAAFSEVMLERLAQTVEQQVDLDAFVAVAATAPAQNTTGFIEPVTRPATSVRIGIAQDRAFGFYYQGDLEALRRAGAELVSIDMLEDTQLPQIDGLFIGGGFPETQADRLSANHALRTQIKQAIENGLPCYAECGGLMYLCRHLQWDDRQWEMAGVIPADAVMHRKPQGRGYVVIEKNSHFPWQDKQSTEHHPTQPLHAHEFHYSGLINIDPSLRFAYDVKRGHGINGKQDGIVYKNLFASYTHLRDVEQNHWAEQFVTFVARQQQQKNLSHPLTAVH